MKPENKPTVPALMLLLPVLLLAGCKLNSLPIVVEPARIPPLTQEARQPEPPKECSPTCSAGLTKLRTELLNSLTSRESPALPASSSTTR